jgi:CMP/dCMP kinase
MLTPAEPNVFESLARLHTYEKGPPKQTGTPITIAISRQAGARGADIGRAVGALLNWPVFDRELLTRIANEKGLHPRLLEHLDEHPVNWLEEILAGLSKNNPTEVTYLRPLLQLLASLAKEGHCIIVGRGAAQALPRESTLRVRIVAPRAARVAVTANRQGVSQAQAEQWVDMTEKERDRFVKLHFLKDPGNLLEYDLILNSARFTNNACAALIVQAARLLEEQRPSAPTTIMPASPSNQ